MTRKLICLALLCSAWGQSGNQAGNVNAMSQQGGKSRSEVTQPATQDEQLSPAQRIPQTAVIVTISGLCSFHAPVAFSPECKTVFTRSQFEQILSATHPNSSQAARKLFATQYTHTLIAARKAHELGLEKQPDFDSRVEVLRLVSTRKALDVAMSTSEWDKISEKQIADYYASHQDEFIQINIERLFVPWFAPDDDPTKPISEAEKKTRNDQSFRDLKVEAEKLYQRALKGEDFLALQIEANKFTGVNNGTSTKGEVVLERFRRKMFTPALVPVMDVEPGHLTPILIEDNGYYIFKVTNKLMLPLEKVQAEIHATLRDAQLEKRKAAIADMAASAPVYNPDYFGSAAPGSNGTPQQNSR